MKKFEYLSIIHESLSESQVKIYFDELGLLGWEAYSTCFDSKLSCRVTSFKREIQGSGNLKV